MKSTAAGRFEHSTSPGDARQTEDVGSFSQTRLTLPAVEEREDDIGREPAQARRQLHAAVASMAQADRRKVSSSALI